MAMHICDALVVSCIDFRFHKKIDQWAEKNLPNKTFDFIGLAGSTKNLDIILNQVDISVYLHHIKQIVLIHHEDCGAYGKASTRESHAKDLCTAKAAMRKKHPDLAVDLYYLHLDGTFEPITS